MSRLKIITIAFLTACIMIASGDSVHAKSSDTVTARPSTSGQLKVQEANLTDSLGRKVMLRGLSLHGFLPKLQG